MKITIVLYTLFALTFAARPYPVDFRERIQPAGRESIRYPGGILKRDSNRIVGGLDDTKDKHPYQISLQKKPIFGNWYHTCGGSILSPTRILTAAHCIDDGVASQYKVIAGEYELYYHEGTEQTVAASQLIYHADWNEAKIDYDFGIVRLSGPLDLKDIHAKPVTLAKVLPKGGASSTVTGWGYTDYSSQTRPTTLQALTTYRYAGHKVGSSTYTPGSYSSIWNNHTQVATFSASGKGICMGDSGGPLVTFTNNTYIQYGICSYVMTPCGGGRPDYYANVPNFMNWINTH